VGNQGASGNSIKAMAPYDSFAVQGSSAGSNLTGMVIASNGIGWVTGKTGFLGYFDTRP
jgi:streptogramin lyase